jgi:hypothetical protein
MPQTIQTFILEFLQNLEKRRIGFIYPKLRDFIELPDIIKIQATGLTQDSEIILTKNGHIISESSDLVQKLEPNEIIIDVPIYC